MIDISLSRKKKSASIDKVSKPAIDSSYQLQRGYQLNVNSLFTQCVVDLNTRIKFSGEFPLPLGCYEIKTSVESILADVTAALPERNNRRDRLADFFLSGGAAVTQAKNIFVGVLPVCQQKFTFSPKPNSPLRFSAYIPRVELIFR